MYNITRQKEGLTMYDNEDDDFEDDNYDDENDYDDDEDDESDEEDNEDPYGDGNEDPFGEEDPEPDDEDELKDDDEKGSAKKSKKKGDGGEAQLETGGGKASVKGKLDVGKMNMRARSLHCGPRTKHICPFCKQKSIFCEPPTSTIIRSSIWYIGGMDRGVRYVCLNPNCKAYFKPGSPSARFKIGESGKLKTSHGLHTPHNPWSIRPIK